MKRAVRLARSKYLSTPRKNEGANLEQRADRLLPHILDRRYGRTYGIPNASQHSADHLFRPQGSHRTTVSLAGRQRAATPTQRGGGIVEGFRSSDLATSIYQESMKTLDVKEENQP